MKQRTHGVVQVGCERGVVPRVRCQHADYGWRLQLMVLGVVKGQPVVVEYANAVDSLEAAGEADKMRQKRYDRGHSGY